MFLFESSPDGTEDEKKPRYFLPSRLRERAEGWAPGFNIRTTRSEHEPTAQAEPLQETRMTADNSSDGLSRFVAAQQDTYSRALAELRAGDKQSHWMWFIFPQIAGLGRSDMARRYAIRDLAEAQAYLAHPVLGQRLRECTAAVLAHAGMRTAEAIFGGVDAVKLRSSMTLFEAAGDEHACADVLDAFFAGAGDPETLRLIDPER